MSQYLGQITPKVRGLVSVPSVVVSIVEPNGSNYLYCIMPFVVIRYRDTVVYRQLTTGQLSSGAMDDGREIQNQRLGSLRAQRSTSAVAGTMLIRRVHSQRITPCVRSSMVVRFSEAMYGGHDISIIDKKLDIHIRKY